MRIFPIWSSAFILSFSLSVLAKTDGDPFQPSLPKLLKVMGAYKLHRVTEFDSFAPTNSIVWSQPSFAYFKVLENIVQAAKKFDVDFEDGEFSLEFDKGRSVYPKSRALKAIRYRGHLYLIDGHHKHAVSLYFGAETVPVDVVDDWTRLKPADFHAKMVANNYAFPLDARGEKADHFWLPSEADNDDLLFMARLAIYKVKLAIRFGALAVYDQDGHWPASILKVNEDVPMLENYAAVELRKEGLKYDPKWGDRLPEKVHEQVRKILVEAQQRADTPLRDALIIADPTLEIPKLEKDPEVLRKTLKMILAHFERRVLCATFLKVENLRDEED